MNDKILFIHTMVGITALSLFLLYMLVESTNNRANVISECVIENKNLPNPKQVCDAMYQRKQHN